ncbi:zinc-dependent alcohol dehydrogenase [Oerskovia sp. USHLN155]|uniref:zinc-dependent alcohol dehydrogenase n=1 Tax=Oerskovia sp. USHLN155 TaxID=3081288 RepID=UPI0030174C24
MRVHETVGPCTSHLVDVEPVVPGRGEVLVRSLALGVCASERGAWGTHDGPEPLRLGHEVAGEIVVLGPDVQGWSVGERVTGFAHPAFAEQIVMATSDLVLVPSGVPTWAALGEPLACIVEAVGRSGVGPGMRVAVVGLGFMGLGALQVALALGADEVVGFDVAPTKRALAVRLGAAAAHDARLVPDGARASFDVVVEFTGTAPGLRLAGDLTGQHGTLCVGGYHHDGPRELDVELWYRGVTVVNGFSPDRDRQRAALRRGMRMMADRQVTFEPLVTHRLAFEDLDAAFRLFEERPEGFVKAVLEL